MEAAFESLMHKVYQLKMNCQNSFLVKQILCIFMIACQIHFKRVRLYGI